MTSARSSRWLRASSRSCGPRRKSPKTICTYLEAPQWLAAGYLVPAGLSDWSDVKARHDQEWIVTLLARYSDCYANNQFRALQQFFKWHATEGPDESHPNPGANLKPPKIGTRSPRLYRGRAGRAPGHLQGRGFQSRRDYAVISLFKDAGIRLSEQADLMVADASPASREATVTGTGDKQPTVRFTNDTAPALDRYMCERARPSL